MESPLPEMGKASREAGLWGVLVLGGLVLFWWEGRGQIRSPVMDTLSVGCLLGIQVEVLGRQPEIV